MFRKALLLMTFGVLLCLPQTATASWYDKGVALVAGQNPELEATGTAAFTSASGGLHCNTGTIRVQATGGTTTGHLMTYSAEDTKQCEVSGGLVLLTGGTTTLKKTQLTGVPSGTHNGSTIAISNFVLHVEFNNGFKLTLSTIEKSPLIIIPDNTTAVTKATSTGEMNTSLSSGKVTVTTSGTILGEASGTYGLVS